MVTVTIPPIVHHLPVMYEPQLVYLPEDDPVIATHAQPIARRRHLHLLGRQIPHGHTRPAEAALPTPVPLDESTVGVEDKPLRRPLRPRLMDTHQFLPERKRNTIL